MLFWHYTTHYLNFQLVSFKVVAGHVRATSCALRLMVTTLLPVRELGQGERKLIEVSRVYMVPQTVYNKILNLLIIINKRSW